MTSQPSIMTIHQSFDYDNFIPYKQNRPLSESHVKKLMESLKRKNRLKSNPIKMVKTTEKKYYIFDGQHRVEACRRLKIPLQYVIEDDVSMQSLLDQQISLNWKWTDYIHKGIKEENPNYIKLENIRKKFAFNTFAISCILSDFSEKEHNDIKKGKFIFSAQLEDFFDKLYIHWENIYQKLTNDQKKYIKSRNFIRCVVRWYKYQNQTFLEMLESLKKHTVDIPFQGNYKQCLVEITNIFNQGPNGGQKQKNRIKFVSFDDLNRIFSDKSKKELLLK